MQGPQVSREQTSCLGVYRLQKMYMADRSKELLHTYLFCDYFLIEIQKNSKT